MKRFFVARVIDVAVAGFVCLALGSWMFGSWLGRRRP